MASGTRHTYLTTQSVTNCTTSPITSSVAILRPRSREEIAVITASCHASGTYTLTIEHSTCNGPCNWEVLPCCAAISANGIVTFNLPVAQLTYLRAIVTFPCCTCSVTCIEVAIFTEIANI